MNNTDLFILIKENEGRKFEACGHNWKIENHNLCLEIEKDKFTPIYTNDLTEYVSTKIEEALSGEEK